MAQRLQEHHLPEARRTHCGPASTNNPDFVRFRDALFAARPAPAEADAAQTFEQGTAEWLESRKFTLSFDGWNIKLGRTSGSTAACAIKKNPFTSERKHIHETVYGLHADDQKQNSTNPAMAWGSGGEEWGVRAFLTWCRARLVGTTICRTDPEAARGEAGRDAVEEWVVEAVDVLHYGMVLDRECARRGYSPDGVVQYRLRRVRDGEVRFLRELLEIKCPYSKREVRDFTSEDLYPCVAVKFSAQRCCVPVQYYAQVMFGHEVMHKAALINSKVSNFVVWVPAHAEDDEDAEDAEEGEYAGKDGGEVVRELDNFEADTDEDTGQLMDDTDPRVRTLRSINVLTRPHGTFQFTRVPHEEAFATLLLKAVDEMWEKIAVVAWVELLNIQHYFAVSARMAEQSPVCKRKPQDDTNETTKRRAQSAKDGRKMVVFVAM
jgi:hypothetical protein